MLSRRIFVSPMTIVSPSTIRGAPEILLAACAAPTTRIATRIEYNVCKLATSYSRECFMRLGELCTQIGGPQFVPGSGGT